MIAMRRSRQSASRTTLWSMVVVILLLFPALVHGVLLAPCASDKDCDTTSEECAAANDKCMPKTCTGPKGTCIDYDSSTYCNAAYSCVRRLSAGDMCSTFKGKNDPVYMNANQCQDGFTCDTASSKCILSGRSTNTTSTSSPSSRTTTPVPSAAASAPTSAPSGTNSTTGQTVDNAGSSSGLTMAQILIIVASVVAGLLLVVFAIRWRRNPKAAQDAHHSPVPAQIPVGSQASPPVNAAATSAGSSGAGAQLVPAKATPQNEPTTAPATLSNIRQPMTSVVVVDTALPPPPPLPVRDNRNENVSSAPASGGQRDLPAPPGTVAVAVDPDVPFLPTSGQQAAVPDPLFLPTSGPLTVVPDPLYLPTTPAPARQPVVDDELFLPPSQSAPRS